MIDRIQVTSTLPLADHLTEKNNRDPGPVNSPRVTKESDDKRTEPSENARKDDFEDYLKDSSILNLTEAKKSNQFDPLADLKKNSIYTDPGKDFPI